MIRKNLLRSACGMGLSLILAFSSISESCMPFAVMAAGEEADEEIAGEELPEAETEGGENVSGEEEGLSENEGSGDEADKDEDSISENDVEGGPEVPQEDYPYTSPDDDPAYKENEVWISAVKDTEFFYNGTAYKPHPYIFYDMEMLKEGKDYTLSWKNNVNAYTCENKSLPTQDDFDHGPQIIVSMKGSFTGDTMACFDIQPLPIVMGEFDTCETSYVYNGKKQNYTPVLEWKGKTLKAGTDYIFGIIGEDGNVRKLTDEELTGKPDENTNLLICIEGKGNFCDRRFTALHISCDPKAVCVDKLKVSSVPVQQYTGEPVTPDTLLKKGKPFEITVSDGKTVLKRGVDYIIYAENDAVDPGKHKMTISGTDNPDGTGGIRYIGEKTVTFTISGSIKNAVVSGVNASYDVKPGDQCVRPDESLVELTLGTKTLPKESYSITYKKDTKAGTATMTFKGQNGFTGKKNYKYKINACSLDKAEIFIGAADYSIKGAQPSVYITYGGESLTKGVDYTYTVKNNKALSGTGKKEPSVTIKGKGLYSGQKTESFRIKKAYIDLENGYELNVPDKAYSPKAGSYVTKITFKDPDGKKLKEGRDFTVVYKDKNGNVLDKSYTASVGEVIYAEISVTGNYEDDIFYADYRIIEKKLDISKAKVSVKDQIYKYSASGVRLPIDDDTIKATLNGERLHHVFSGKYVDESLSGEVNGFEILPETYKNNMAAGTASVVIRGVGIYGGTKTIKYNIKAKRIKGVDPHKYIPVPAKYLDVTDFGAIPDDGVDDTIAIVSAINATSKDTENDHNLYFPAGRYNVGKSANINIGVPDVHITMDAEAELYVAAQGDSYNVILIHEDNISIRGGKISGERFRHSGGPTGQYGMGISITDGNNITIQDMIIRDNRGDGIYINDNGNKTVKNVIIKGCDIIDNARNNICVIRGDYITIENCNIKHESDGHSPMAGIDLEPDMSVGNVKDNKKVKHVVIRKCKIETYNHWGAREQPSGLWAYFGIMIISGFGQPVVEDVLIEDCDIYGDLSKGSSSGLVIRNTTVHGEILPGDT